MEDLHWEIVGEKKGVLLSKAEVPGTKIIAFRGDMILPSPLLKVAQVVRDPGRGPEWVAGLKASRVLRPLGPFAFLEYDRMGLPFPVRDRDFVTRCTTEALPAENRIIVKFVSVEDEECPPVKGLIRGQLLWAAFEMEGLPGGTTRVRAEAVGDPKGRLPKWLVNFFQKSWPRVTLLNLASQAAKPDVVEDAELKALWPPLPEGEASPSPHLRGEGGTGAGVNTAGPE